MKQQIDLREIFECLHNSRDYIVIKGYKYVTTYEKGYELPLSITSYVKDGSWCLELIGYGYKGKHITILLQKFLQEKFGMFMVFRWSNPEEQRIVYELFKEEELEED